MLIVQILFLGTGTADADMFPEVDSNWKVRKF